MSFALLRLATAKDVAHLAATIGRQFSYALLEVLTPLDEPALQRELRRLVEAELLVATACASPAKTRAASSWLMSRPRWQFCLHQADARRSVFHPDM